MSAPVLDDAVVDRLASDVGAELIEEILGVFVEDATRIVGELRDAAAKHDRKAASALAHTLKGTCGTVGATRLGELARSLEAHVVGGGDVGAVALQAIEQTLALTAPAVEAAIARFR